MSDDLVDRQLLILFFEEAKERTVAIESSLLKLEKAETPADREEIVMSIMRVAHSLKGSSGFVEMRSIEKACHWMEDELTAVKTGKKNLCKEMFERLLMVNDAINQSARTSLAGAVDESLVRDALASIKSSKAKPQIDRASEKPGLSVVQTPLPVERSASPVVAAPANESIRISLSKLDALLYRSEELLKSRERLLKRRQEAADLYELALDFDKDRSNKVHDQLLSKIMSLTDNLDEDYRTLETATFFLEDEVRRARTQAFKDACVGLSRVVRDACGKSGKTAELIVDGDHVDIDQSIVQGMNDILRHLVRNSIDHGIEKPDERVDVGKNPSGTISVIARTTGDRLRVQVKDDGRGVPLLRQIAEIRKTSTDELEERLLMQELFRPGYTTAASVTELSGRGVGLDVVKRTVERLRGYLEVSLNEVGGTTFTIVLPLSLTVTRGLVFNVADQRFAIETATARRLIRLPGSSVHRDGKKLTIEYGTRQVPALYITEWLFGHFFDAPENDEFDVVLIGDDDNEIAVLVNHVSGEQELLVRPLGPRASGNRKYNGAATLSNGEMILILNPVALQEGALGVKAEGKSFSHTVLVVDDSPTVRNAHKRQLEARGFAVEVTVNGSEAWEKLQTLTPDIIVADVDMPGMDGLTLAETIRADKGKRKIPIILVTSRANKRDRERSKKAKVNAYIIKNSAQHERLGETVSKILSKAKT
ncbi:response regulator [Mesorhizobium sp. SP-1A]|uniref:hybrid sensor histidine kinase/response regulator n=1 Tax=Mesorhizobium sp. SP-1A TaxID=3077840 RepID=UPI0028F6EAC7|nr:response regulator [Mesorhizobium sp. SP-1A]